MGRMFGTINKNGTKANSGTGLEWSSRRNSVGSYTISYDTGGAVPVVVISGYHPGGTKFSSDNFFMVSAITKNSFEVESRDDSPSRGASFQDAQFSFVGMF